MKIGLIDVDGHNYPNLPLMKLSAWHKSKGDHVEWYQPMFSGHMDIVYMSKVFSFTPDYVLCGDHEREVLEQDLYRIGWLRDNGYAPYVMLYDKEHLPKGHELRKLQRWVNNRFIFWKCATFEEYKATKAS